MGVKVTDLVPCGDGLLLLGPVPDMLMGLPRKVGEVGPRSVDNSGGNGSAVVRDSARGVGVDSMTEIGSWVYRGVCPCPEVRLT